MTDVAPMGRRARREREAREALAPPTAALTGPSGSTESAPPGAFGGFPSPSLPAMATNPPADPRAAGRAGGYTQVVTPEEQRLQQVHHAPSPVDQRTGHGAAPAQTFPAGASAFPDPAFPDPSVAGPAFSAAPGSAFPAAPGAGPTFPNPAFPGSAGSPVAGPPMPGSPFPGAAAPSPGWAAPNGAPANAARLNAPLPGAPAPAPATAVLAGEAPSGFTAAPDRPMSPHVSPYGPGGYAPTSDQAGRRSAPAGHDGRGGHGPGGRIDAAAPGMPGQPGHGRGRHATTWGQGFGRVVGWTLAGSLFPGLGLYAAGRRWAAALTFAVTALLAGVVVALFLSGDPVAAVASLLLAHPERLTYLALGVVALGLGWGTMVVGTNLALRRFADLTTGQRALSAALVTTLVGTGLSASVIGARDLQLGGQTIDKVFTSGREAGLDHKRGTVSGANPFGNRTRMNVLLIGSDAGADRTGLRTDTVMVASIDVTGGETVLFQLPRNLEHVPFPAGSPQEAQYPTGFYCPDHSCLLNALWQFGVEHKTQYYPNAKNPGLTALWQGVEQTTGLQLDDYAMVDLRGFMQFVDATGGLEINVERRIPVGGRHNTAGREVGVTSYIEPGRQLLNGYQSLWYARSRSDSDDFDRMRRQRCVIGAVTQQLDPRKVLVNLPAIMAAARDNIVTSITSSELEGWVDLAGKVKKAHVRSLPFTNRVIAPGDPDFTLIKERIQTEINRPAGYVAPKPTPTAAPSASTSPRVTRPSATGSPSAGEDPTVAQDVKNVC